VIRRRLLAFIIAAPGRVQSGVALLVGTSVGLAPSLSLLAARMTYYSRSQPFQILEFRFQIHQFEIFNLQFLGGADGIRTHYLFNAIEALSQLSYSPKIRG
jgi:hypothetical protein